MDLRCLAFSPLIISSLSQVSLRGFNQIEYLDTTVCARWVHGAGPMNGPEGNPQFETTVSGAHEGTFANDRRVRVPPTHGLADVRVLTGRIRST
jgi:hypothetical protein